MVGGEHGARGDHGGEGDADGGGGGSTGRVGRSRRRNRAAVAVLGDRHGPVHCPRTRQAGVGVAYLSGHPRPGSGGQPVLQQGAGDHPRRPPQRLAAVPTDQAASAESAARHEPRGLEPPGYTDPDWDLDACRDIPAQRPVWLFSSGPVGDHPACRHEAVDVTGMVAATNPRSHQLFAERIDKDRLGFAERAVVWALGVADGDSRDWDAIARWPDEIVSSFTADMADDDDV